MVCCNAGCLHHKTHDGTKKHLKTNKYVDLGYIPNPTYSANVMLYFPQAASVLCGLYVGELVKSYQRKTKTHPPLYFTNDSSSSIRMELVGTGNNEVRKTTSKMGEFSTT